MDTLRERLRQKRVLVADGAWGTLLQARGLEPGECPELWNVTHPDRLRAVAAAYAAAGSDLVLTNTFGGSPLALARHGLEERTEELNAAGARLSLQAVHGTGTLVAASIGPTGELPAPLGTLSEEEMERCFRRQILAVARAGVRLLCIETMIHLPEAACAVRAARQAEQELGTRLEVMATLSYQAGPQGFRTVMGNGIAETVEALERAGADVLGSNCGNGIEQMVPITAEFRARTDRPLLIQPNAGLPRLEGGRTVFRQDAEELARHVPALLAAGATIVGGCCGTGPEHIAAIRKAVDRAD